MHYDIVIIGAGAAGLMAGAIAGKRGRRVLILDHAKKPAEKIRISGGGRCNFTNLHSGPNNFISNNKHFCKSALAGYTPDDFINLVKQYGIAFHEKNQTGMQLGQLFCDGSSQEIIDMLLSECRAAGNEIWLKTEVDIPEKTDAGFCVKTSRETVTAGSVIVACGGPSIPKMGATGFGYKIARNFDMNVTDVRPALVPLTFTGDDAAQITNLAGLAAPAHVHAGKTGFKEAILFTHRGLSGPAILQISSYWEPGRELILDLAPDIDIAREITAARLRGGKQSPAGFLSAYMPARLAEDIASGAAQSRLGDMTSGAMDALVQRVKCRTLKPAGTEGYRKAEVTLGGVDTAGLNSKTMEARQVPGLYFVGETVDVTGHLGGHNFQWAWASGYAAGQNA